MSQTEAGPRLPPTWSNLLRLAWPIVVSRSTQAVVGLTDAYMVAHLGDEALAATTTGSMNAFALFILPMGVVFAVSTFASQHLGRGDPAGGRRFAWYGLGVAIAAAVGGLLALPVLPSALALAPVDPTLRASIVGYLALRLPSAGAVVGLEALGNYYGGVGNTRLPMVAALAALVANVTGNWLLIDGHLGLPALGVQGAALASSGASTLAFLGLLAWFLRSGPIPRGLLAREAGALLRVGVPVGLNWFFEFFAFLFFVDVVVGGLGTTSLAALMAVLQLNSVSFMPAFAVASAGAIVVGQSIGADARDEVPLGVRRAFTLAGAWQGSIGLAYLAFPELLFSPFVQGQASETLLAIGARMLALSAIWQLFDAAANTLAEALRATGDTSWPLAARLVLAWGVFVPGSWLSVHALGGDEGTAMLWLTAYLALLSAALLWRFQSGAWRAIELLSPVPP